MTMHPPRQFVAASRLVRALALPLALVAAPAAMAQQTFTLPQAIELAQRQGLAARAAINGRDGIRQRDRAFGSRLLPQLSLSGNVPQYSSSIVQVIQPDGTTKLLPQDQTISTLSMGIAQKVPLTGADVFVTTGLQRYDVGGSKFTRTWNSTPFSVTLSQPINRPNTYKWDGREQALTIDVGERQYLEARETVAMATVNAFFDLYSARETLANAVADAAVNDTLYTLSKVRFEVGKIAENDLLQGELQLLRARASQDAAKLDLEQKTAAFRLAVNLPAGAPINVVEPAQVPSFDADTAVAVAQALRNKSFVAANDLLNVQANRAVNLARLNTGAGANVSATYGYNATGPEMNSAYQNLLPTKRLTLALSTPLVQWGAHSADVEAARADQRRVAATTRITREQAMNDAHYGALQLTLARSNLAIAAKADTVAARQFEVAYNRYVIGHIGIDILFQAQTSKDAAVQAYVQALRGYWVAYYTLRQLTLYDFEAGRPIE